jgi:dihydrofolate reductase
VEAMKRQPGKDMMSFGSESIFSALTALGLIDEYQLVVNPVLLGSGRQLMNGVSASTKLELVETKPQATGNVLLRYAHRAG